MSSSQSHVTEKPECCGRRDTSQSFCPLVKVEISVDGKERGYACSVCGMDFSSGGDYVSHYRESHITEVAELFFSDITVKDEPDLIPQTEVRQSSRDVTLRTDDSYSKEMIPEQLYVADTFSDGIDYLEANKTSRSYESSKCPHCPFVTNPTLLRKHVKKNHATQTKASLKPLKCPHCRCAPITQSALEDHILKLHSNLKPYVCIACGYKCIEKRLLDEHMEIHSAWVGIGRRNTLKIKRKNKKSYPCPKCHQSFPSKHYLKNHMTGSHLYDVGQSSVGCSLCFHVFFKGSGRSRLRIRRHFDQHIAKNKKDEDTTADLTV